MINTHSLLHRGHGVWVYSLGENFRFLDSATFDCAQYIVLASDSNLDDLSEEQTGRPKRPATNAESS